MNPLLRLIVLLLVAAVLLVDAAPASPGTSLINRDRRGGQDGPSEGSGSSGRHGDGKEAAHHEDEHQNHNETEHHLEIPHRNETELHGGHGDDDEKNDREHHHKSRSLDRRQHKDGGKVDDKKDHKKDDKKKDDKKKDDKDKEGKHDDRPNRNETRFEDDDKHSHNETEHEHEHDDDNRGKSKGHARSLFGRDPRGGGKNDDKEKDHGAEHSKQNETQYENEFEHHENETEHEHENEHGHHDDDGGHETRHDGRDLHPRSNKPQAEKVEKVKAVPYYGGTVESRDALPEHKADGKPIKMPKPGVPKGGNGEDK